MTLTAVWSEDSLAHDPDRSSDPQENRQLCRNQEVMTTTTQPLQAWATKPLGKAARVAMAGIGMAMATMVLMTAAVVESGSWALVLLGVALAATSVRAAWAPTVSRLTALIATVIAIPLSLQIF